MAKTKTSGKQKEFLLDNFPIRKLKNPEETLPHHPATNLKDPQFIARAVFQCLAEGDYKALKEILKSHYEAINTAKALKNAGLSRRTFYEAVSEIGNPRLDTFSKIIKGLVSGSNLDLNTTFSTQVLIKKSKSKAA